MSDTTTRKKKRDRFLEALSLRSSSRSPSSQPSVSRSSVTLASLTTVPNVSAQPSAVTSSLTGQAVGGASSIKEAAFREKVLEHLTEDQRSVLDLSYAKSSDDVNSTLTVALQAAENKKQLCISKQWTLKVGSRAISTREKAEKVVELLDKFKRIGDIVAGADPIHFGLPWAGVSLILQVAASEKQQMDAMLSGVATALSMQRTLDVYLAFSNTLPPEPPAKILETALVETYAAVLGFLATSIGLLTKDSISRFWTALLGSDDLQTFGSTCLAAEHRIEVAASNCDRSLDARGRVTAQECKGILDLVLGDIDAIKNQTARIELSISLAKLPRASTAAFDSTDEERLPRCLKNTRVELLADIQGWVQDPRSAQFFWLQGVAGTGKSTVARTIANIFHDHQILGASFFFKRGHAERGSADLFFATIAIQLAQRIPGVDGALARLLDNEVGVYRKGIHTQFRDLVLNPLQATVQSRQVSHLELVILIDALDECDDEGNRKGDTKQILECLAQLKGIHGLRLRLIVTSRLEFPVEVGFAALGNDAHDNILLHELPRSEIERDIRIFIEAEFEQLRHILFQRRHREVLHDGWPGDDVVRDLTKRSVPLFIFASTVCSFVADGRFTPQDQLKKVLDNRNPVQLSSTYLLVLQAMVPESGTGTNWDVDVMDNFRKVVGLVIFSTEPPSITTIAVLLGLTTGQVEATLDNLHSVLDVTSDLDRPVRPFHLSFIEFLARPKSAHNFQIDERATHHLLADRCLAVMMQPGGLQQDICQVRKPGSRRLETGSHVVESHISPALAYACRYWVHHMEARNVLIDDQHDTLVFLSGWFLYWYEVMAWSGRASDTPRTLRKLQIITKASYQTTDLWYRELTNTQTNGATKIAVILGDAYHFARRFQYIADLAPLQLYVSALAFAPDISIIRKLFKHCMPSWLSTSPTVEGDWPNDALDFEGHTDTINDITFSPDDKLIVTCSDDGAARVWDTTDADCLLIVSRPERCLCPCAVAFSSNSSKIAVAYKKQDEQSVMERDRPAKISVVTYDAKTGALLRTTERLVLQRCRLAVAFGKGDAINLAVAHPGHVQLRHSTDNSNILNHAWTSRFEAGDLDSPFSVAISRDASLLCCSGNSKGDNPRDSIAVLDLKSGAVIGMYKRDEHLYHIAFSGKDPVYETRGKGSGTRCLKDLDVATGKSTRLCEYDGLQQSLFSVSNARDRIALSLSGYIAHMEALSQDKRVGNGSREPPVTFVAVATKGNIVVIVRGGYLEVLDTRGFVAKKVSLDIKKSWGYMVCLTISPDCQYVALGHQGGTMIWSTRTGKFSPYDGIGMLSNNSIQSLSGDNRSLACAIGTKVSLWSLESKEMLLSAALPKIGMLRRLRFSADGKHLLTDRGSFHIASATWIPKAEKSFVKEIGLAGSKKFPCLPDEWIRFADEDVLWIPNEHRASPKMADAQGGTVALAQEDGSVMILTFSDPSTT